MCRITLFGVVQEEIFDIIFKRFAEIEKKMNLYRTDRVRQPAVRERNTDGTESVDPAAGSDSVAWEISLVNEQAGVEPVQVSKDTFFVVERGLEYSSLFDGRFDISVGPLVDLWDIGSENPRIPSVKEIEKKLGLVNFSDIRLDKDKYNIFLEKRGMMIDLGGIAKGYAADEAARILREKNIRHAIVDIGGNILVLDSKPDGSAWRIGIQNPAKPRGEYCGILKVTDSTVVTSGVYERYFEQDGKSYHHILDTRNGYPVANSLLSVTIEAASSLSADAISTGIFAMGLNKGREFAEQNNIEAIFITGKFEIYITNGIKDSFVLTNSDFTLKGP